MRIAVVGSGYVGLVAGACFADLGHDVILVDNDEQKLAALKNGQVPIHEKFLPELLSRHRGTAPDFFRRSARSRARQFGDFHRRGHAAHRAWRSRSVLRRVRGSRDFRRHQRLQGHRRKEHGSGLHQRMGAQDHPAQRRRSRNPSTWLPTPSSCAKARRSPTFFIPTASWSAATTSAAPTCCARSMLR